MNGKGLFQLFLFRMFRFAWEVRRLFATLFFIARVLSLGRKYIPTLHPPVMRASQSRTERIARTKENERERNRTVPVSLYCVRFPLLPHLTLIGLILQSVPGADRYCILSLEGGSPPRGAPRRFYWM